jgi:hypothetical protein
MQQNIPLKRVPKLTERAKACLDEQNKVSKKRRNDEKGGEGAPKKARPDQQSGSDDTEFGPDKPFQATTPSIETGPNASTIDDGRSDSASSEGPEIIEPPTSQSKVMSTKQTARGKKDLGELKHKACYHQLTVEWQHGQQSSTHPSMACLNTRGLLRWIIDLHTSSSAIGVHAQQRCDATLIQRMRGPRVICESMQKHAGERLL